MGTAWTYRSDPEVEHDAIRTAAGLFDVSALKKVHVRGPDAAATVDHVITRNMATIYPGKSAYGAILTEHGKICDDAIIANNGNNEWLLVHGTGENMERLLESAADKNVDIEFDDDLHDISLQGPLAAAFLNQHTPLDLLDMKYFHQASTQLFGHPCLISRTGYSGERGYELFASASASASVIGDIWDNILGHGADLGIIPCSFASLDKVRIEAALLFYGYDMITDHSPWEVGLGWSVSRKKGTFRGKEAVFALESQEKANLVGLDIQHNKSLEGGEQLRFANEEVGMVNSLVWSHRLNKSLALAHVRPDLNQPGTQLEVNATDFSCEAIVTQTPFYDPHKSRPHA